MKPAAEVVVIGAGIIGSSIAYQLARRGASVTALDKGQGPGEGSTGASSSICRGRYSHRELVALARYGIDAFSKWADFTGLDEPRSSFDACGALWMTGDPSEKVEAEAGMLRSQGVSADVIGPPDVKRMFPSLSCCVEKLEMTDEGHTCRDGGPFLFEPRAGFADPVGANQDLVDAARNQGAEVRFRSQVIELLDRGGEVGGVVLSDGRRMEADLVINAAGPWFRAINDMAGVLMPWTITPTRIQTIYRSWPSELGALPYLADGSTGMYLRPMASGQQIMVGSVVARDEEEIVEDPDHFKQVPDADFIQEKLAFLHHRVPSLEPRGEVSGIAGLYTINREDVHPVLGPSGVDGLWLANGFSGHGFKLAPAFGSMIAAAITGVEDMTDPEVPLDFFSINRSPLHVATKSVLA